jgi:hypothetical protein
MTCHRCGCETKLMRGLRCRECGGVAVDLTAMDLRDEREDDER